MAVSRLKKPTFYTIEESRDNAFATGGTVTTAGGYRIHTFTSADSLVVTNPGNIEYLVVAGGGGGGSSLGGTYLGGGAGAGGLLTGTLAATATTYALTIGNGAAGMAASTLPTVQGGNTTAFGLTATGGGGGGYAWSTARGGGGNGGSGGGHGEGGGSAGPGTGIAGQGFAGGSGGGYSGGGGATGAGFASLRMTSGGPGLTSSITGTSVEYAKGGGGVDGNRTGDNASNIGSGGFGGQGSGAVAGGNGTNGIVIVRYLNS